jgi:hypothetical protein
MNLLVLINLIMACVLGIRVALRTAKIVLVVASAVFAALGIVSPPLFAASGATSAAAAAVQNVGGVLDPEIDVALQALNKAQDLIAATTPTLAKIAATKSVGDHYRPTVGAVATMELAGLRSSLPVEHKDPTVLCKHAAAALPDLTTWLLQQTPLGAASAPLGFITPIMVALAGADTDGFCGLQSNGGGGNSGNGGAGGNGGGNNGKTGPALDKSFDDNAARICQDLEGGDSARKAFEDKEQEWLAECQRAGVSCQSRDPQSGAPLKSGTQNGHSSLVRPDKQDEQFVLDELRLERDQDIRTLDGLTLHLAELELNPTKCVAFEKADLKQRHAEQLALQQRQPQQAPAQANKNGGQNSGGQNSGGQNNGGQNNGGSSSSGTTASMAVVSAWHNGAKEAQIIGGAEGNDAVLQRSASLVRVATVPKRAPQVSAPEAAGVPALAQAELFYDCGGKWADCNGSDEEAMWHFKWRARLRRFNQSFDATQQEIAPQVGVAPPRTGPDVFADQLAQDALGNNAFDSNAALRHDLASSLRDNSTRTQGVH